MDLPYPFFKWSIAEAWDWFIHVPYLGFIVGVLAIVIVTALLVGSLRDRDKF
jgi:hypothetical protein